MSNISDRVDTISKKIEELIKEQFTGSVTLRYNFLQGRLMGVGFETREQISKNAELVNINDLSTFDSNS